MRLVCDIQSLQALRLPASTLDPAHNFIPGALTGEIDLADVASVEGFSSAAGLGSSVPKKLAVLT